MSRDREDVASPKTGVGAIVDKAQPLAVSVRAIAIGSAVAAAWLSMLAWVWFRPDSWGWVPLGAFFIVLLLPVLVLLTFLFGLRQIVQLPQRIGDLGATGTQSAAAAYRAVRPASESSGRKHRVWRLFRAIRDLQRAILDGKGTLLGYVALAKFINPWVMGVVVVALGAAMGVIGIAGIVTVITFFVTVF